MHLWGLSGDRVNRFDLVCQTFTTTAAIVVIAMATTIQVEDERKARLARLKVGGMTYDDVIDQLLRGIDEEHFRRLALEWQSDLARRIRSKPSNRRLL